MSILTTPALGWKLLGAFVLCVTPYVLLRLHDKRVCRFANVTGGES